MVRRRRKDRSGIRDHRFARLAVAVIVSAVLVGTPAVVLSSERLGPHDVSEELSRQQRPGDKVETHDISNVVDLKSTRLLHDGEDATYWLGVGSAKKVDLTGQICLVVQLKEPLTTLPSCQEPSEFLRGGITAMINAPLAETSVDVTLLPGSGNPENNRRIVEAAGGALIGNLAVFTYPERPDELEVIVNDRSIQLGGNAHYPPKD